VSELPGGGLSSHPSWRRAIPDPGRPLTAGTETGSSRRPALLLSHTMYSPHESLSNSDAAADESTRMTNWAAAGFSSLASGNAHTANNNYKGAV
jgi:hypothetical protein